MSLVRAVFRMLPIVLASLCLATTSIQAAAVTTLWAAGAMTRDKLVRYAAVVYGLDLSELGGGEEETGPAHSPVLSREEILNQRVQSSPLLASRQSAVRQGTDDTHILFNRLQSDTERFHTLKERFDNHLKDLEQDIRAQSIQDLRATLEILAPRQSKELILRMLRDEGLDPNDDVVADVVTIVKNLPQDKLKKLLAEFRSPQDQAQLHRILLEIGEFRDRD